MFSRDKFSKSEMQKMLLSTQTREGLRITGKFVCHHISPNKAHCPLIDYFLYSSLFCGDGPTFVFNTRGAVHFNREVVPRPSRIFLWQAKGSWRTL